jgi:hypothetical protein
MARKKRVRYMKRDALKRQIYELLLTAKRPVTRGEILRHLGRSHSSWTNQLFEEMVAEKYLLPPVVKRQGNLVKVTYEANDISKEV